MQKPRVEEYLKEEEPNNEDEDFIDDIGSIEEKRVESFDENTEDTEDKEDEEDKDESSERSIMMTQGSRRRMSKML